MNGLLSKDPLDRSEKMGKRPEIAQTKRSLYRPMNQMNGDYLAQLKKPVCSELTPDFRGGTRARQAQCRQQVDLWYKDQEFTLRRLSRSEDVVYGTLLSVSRDRRRLQREKHQKHQAEARDISHVPQVLVLPAIATLPARDEEVQEASARKVPSSRRTEEGTTDPSVRNDKCDPQTHLNVPAPIGKSKVLEVTKNRTDPIVRERTEDLKKDKIALDEDNKKDNIKASEKKTPKKKRKKSQSLNTTDSKSDPLDNLAITSEQEHIRRLSSESMPAPLRSSRAPRLSVCMPIIDEDSDNPTAIDTEAIDAALPMRRNSATLYPPSPSSHAPRPRSSSLNFGLVTQAQNPLVSKSSDSFLSVNSLKQSHDNSDKLWSRESEPTTRRKTKTKQNNNQADTRSLSEPVPRKTKRPESLVVLNRRRRREQAAKRKAILDAESPSMYERDENGHLVPAIRTFRRRAFSTPSMREQHYRKKLLQQLQVLKDLEAERIDSFFNKLDLERPGEAEAPRPPRARAQPVEEEPTRPAPNHGGGLPSLTRLSAIFSHSHAPVLPEGVEPGSIEAMRHCGYLRNSTHDEE